MAAPEIRLGSLENLPNIQLGSVQVEEVRLGNVLVWRNNVPPFFNLLVNGILVDTNGTPMTPEDPDDPATAVLTVFEYTDTINIEAQGVIDSDLHYPVSIDLYNGDFDIDDTLPSLASGSVATASGSVTLSVPRGPQPTGANAADFIYADRLYSLVAVDNEDAASIIYFRITITDSADTPVFTAFSNSGPLMTGLTSSSTATGLSTTFNTQCFDPTSTTETFNRTTITTFNRQPQSRTCSRQIVGVMDTAFDPCVGARLTQNVDTTTGTTSSDTVTGTTMQPNGAYIPGADRNNAVGGSTCVSVAAMVTPGVCADCTAAPFDATCSSTRTDTNQPQCQDQNCDGTFIGSPRNNGAASTFTNNCAGTNTNYFPPAAPTGSIGPSPLNNGGTWNGTITGDTGRLSCSFVCADGSTPTAPTRNITCPAGMEPSVTGMPCTANRSASGSCNMASTGGVMSGTCTVSSRGLSTTFTF